MLKQGTNAERIRNYRRKHLLADIALKESCEDKDKPNYCLYVCATHLSQVPELNVNVHEFERLSQYPLDSKFDTEVYVQLRSKLSELKNLISTLTFDTEG